MIQESRLSALSLIEVAKYRVWRMVGDDSEGEAVVKPVTRLPVSKLNGCLVTCQVSLGNTKEKVWSLIGNIHPTLREINDHFLTISIEHNGEWFFLSRYHDVDFKTNGPDALCKFLGLSKDAVFPIKYDISDVVVGKSDCLRGEVPFDRDGKKNRKELIAMVVQLGRLNQGRSM